MFARRPTSVARGEGDSSRASLRPSAATSEPPSEPRRLNRLRGGHLFFRKSRLCKKLALQQYSWVFSGSGGAAMAGPHGDVLVHDIQSLDWRGTDLGYDVGRMGYETDGTDETDGNGSDATDGNWVR